MMDYIWLLAAIVCTLIMVPAALVTVAVTHSVFKRIQDEEEMEKERQSGKSQIGFWVRAIAVVGAALITLISAKFAGQNWYYLYQTNYDLLVIYAHLWMTGFVIRIIVLEIIGHLGSLGFLNKHFEPEWKEIILLPYVALLGPLVILLDGKLLLSKLRNK